MYSAPSTDAIAVHEDSGYLPSTPLISSNSLALATNKEAVTAAAQTLRGTLCYRRPTLTKLEACSAVLLFLQAELEVRVQTLREQLETETAAIALLDAFSATPIAQYPYEQNDSYRVYCYDSDVDTKAWAVGVGRRLLADDFSTEDEAYEWAECYVLVGAGQP